MPFKDPAAHRDSQRRSYQRRKEKIKKNLLERKTRLKLEMAGGRSRPSTCDVCDLTSHQIVFDHCHQSGKFRGWICYGCNIALGHTKDNPETLRALANYLEQSGTSENLNGENSTRNSIFGAQAH